MTAPLISIRELEFAYDGDRRRVLDGLSLDLEAGTITAILGPNGAGKTTLILLLLGILKPVSGEIQLDGTRLQDIPRREISRKIAFVPQVEHTAFDFSVEEYVLMGRAPHLGMLKMPTTADQQKTIDQLEALDLLELRDRSILELSGGERQMSLIARALAQEPELLLLDEPTAHLDLSNKSRILSTLSDLAGSGVSVVFTTHDPDAAAASAEQLVMMRDGQVLASGPIESVLKAELLTATYGVPVRVAQVDGQPVVVLEKRR